MNCWQEANLPRQLPGGNNASQPSPKRQAKCLPLRRSCPAIMDRLGDEPWDRANRSTSSASRRACRMAAGNGVGRNCCGRCRGRAVLPRLHSLPAQRLLQPVSLHRSLLPSFKVRTAASRWRPGSIRGVIQSQFVRRASCQQIRRSGAGTVGRPGRRGTGFVGPDRR